MRRREAGKLEPVLALLTGLAVGFTAGRGFGGCELDPWGEDTPAASGEPGVGGQPPPPSPSVEPSVHPEHGEHLPADPPRPSGAPVPPPPVEPAADLRVPLGRHNARRGTTGAKATVVELIDFTSRECAEIAPTLNQLRDAYPTELAVVVMHMPADEEGPAMGAALAMQAALRQRKHWEMHDAMLAHQAALGRADLLAYAAELGLDVATFERDLADPSVAQEVQSDLAVARRLGVDRAPTFFINCQQLSGAASLEALQKAVDPQIARAAALLAGGLPEHELYPRLCQP